MARATIPFQTAFDRFARALKFTPAQVAANAALQAELLDQFSETYHIGYDEGGADGWTDSRQGATIEPVDGLITFDVLGNARNFEVFSEDPRPCPNDAQRLKFSEDNEGILLADTSVTECWVRWHPITLDFTTTAWAAGTYAVGDVVLYTDGECYRRLVAGASTNLATELAEATPKWVVVPVLEVLMPFVKDYARGEYLLANSQAEVGIQLQNRALAALETKATREINNRLRSPDTCNYAVAGAASGATSRYVRFDAAQTLTDAQAYMARSNQKLTITDGGYLRIVNAAGTVFHIGLNLGEPPG